MDELDDAIKTMDINIEVDKGPSLLAHVVVWWIVLIILITLTLIIYKYVWSGWLL